MGEEKQLPLQVGVAGPVARETTYFFPQSYGNAAVEATTSRQLTPALFAQQPVFTLPIAVAPGASAFVGFDVSRYREVTLWNAVAGASTGQLRVQEAITAMPGERVMAGSETLIAFPGQVVAPNVITLPVRGTTLLVTLDNFGPNVVDWFVAAKGLA